MGAWGTKPFDNDSAGDFLDAVFEGGITAIEDAFDHVLEAGADDLEAPTAEEAIAAAAIVARLKDGVPLTGEEEIEAWIAEEQPVASPELAARARDALVRVLTAPSELMELWQDTDDFADFKAGIDALVKRLG